MARPRSFDEAAVLRAARDKFWSSGYAGTKVDDIAAATGLGKGSLYGAFGDKHALFLRVYDDYCTEADEGTRRALKAPTRAPTSGSASTSSRSPKPPRPTATGAAA